MFRIILITIFNVILLTSASELNEDSTLEEFFDQETEKVNDFLQNQLSRIKQVVNTTYIGIDSAKLKTDVDGYLENQKNVLAADVDKFVKHLKTSNKKAADIWSSFMPTEDTNSRLENPEMVLPVPGIIARNGYDCETHTIVSQGHILNVHRIPKPKNGKIISKNTVILQHGLLDTSFSWIVNGPEKSLAYVLADAGYDVWLPNIRGNRYARDHAWYKTNTKEFWNFSFHEIAQHDIPALIDHIRQLKGNDTKIAFIGYSMGTSILFSMLSLRPEYNDVLSAGVALAPAVFLSSTKLPLLQQSIKFYAEHIAHTAMKLNSYEFLQKDLLDSMAISCNNDFGKMICRTTIFHYVGFDNEQFNNFMSTFLLKGSSASWKTIIHISQMINSGRFQLFDYGKPEYNRLIYGSNTVPDYDLSKAKLNISLFWTENDLLSNEKDVLLLHEKLPNAQLYRIPSSKFNHIDFLWAEDTPLLVNDKVLAVLEDSFK